MFKGHIVNAQNSCLIRRARGIAVLAVAVLVAFFVAPAQAQSPVARATDRSVPFAGLQGHPFNWALRTQKFARELPNLQLRYRPAPGGGVSVPGAGGVVLDQSTHTLYVVSGTTGLIAVVDARTCNARRQHCHAPVGFIQGAQGPAVIAVNSSTHTLYVSYPDAGDLGVLDTRHCNVRSLSGCAAPTMLHLGGVPIGVVVDTRTDTVYVGNVADKISVIDGSSCNGSHLSRCAAGQVATIRSGPGPILPYLDAGTHTLYVSNNGNDDVGGNTVSVVDIRACKATDTSGCGATPASIDVGGYPLFIAVDSRADSVFVGIGAGATVSVFDRRSCNARDTSGCGSQTPASIKIGSNPENLIVRGKTQTLYATTDSDTIAAVDIRRCNARNSSGCDVRPRTLQTGAAPYWTELDPRTDSLYIADYVGGKLEVLDARSCNALRSKRCRREAPTVAGGNGGGSMDPGHHTLYQPLVDEHAIGFIDTASCNAHRRSGCRQTILAAPIGGAPGNMAIDLGTHSLYVVDGSTSVLEIINTNSCNITRQDGCTPVVTVPLLEGGVVGLNTRTHTVYVTQFSENAVAVIRGAHCNASDHSNCSVVNAPAADGPRIPWVDLPTNTLYVTGDTNTLAILPGAACDSGSPACHLIATTAVGSIPVGLATDTRTHTLFVGNWAFGDELGSVSIVDTHTCGALDTSGCDTAWPRVSAGHGTFGVMYEPTKHRIYTTNASSATVSVIDTARCNAIDTRGCRAVSPQIAVGYFPTVSYVDPIRHTLYVENAADVTASILDVRHPCRMDRCFRLPTQAPPGS